MDDSNAGDADHGDHIIITRSRAGNGGGLVMLGRSDGVLYVFCIHASRLISRGARILLCARLATVADAVAHKTRPSGTPEECASGRLRYTT